jgi:hypothetical protein
MVGMSCVEVQAAHHLSFFYPRTSLLNSKVIFIGLDALYNGNTLLERFLLLYSQNSICLHEKSLLLPPTKNLSHY